MIARREFCKPEEREKEDGEGREVGGKRGGRGEEWQAVVASSV